MDDGSRIQFIWNKDSIWQPVSLTLDKKYKNAYWMNAETGTIIPVEDLKDVKFVIPAYSSVLLFASTKTNIAANLLGEPEPAAYKAKEVLKISRWDVQAGTVSIKDTSLFDWRENARFEFSSVEGIYKSSFQLDELYYGRNLFDRSRQGIFYSRSTDQ